jgi:hypothetical protein
VRNHSPPPRYPRPCRLPAPAPIGRRLPCVRAVTEKGTPQREVQCFMTCLQAPEFLRARLHELAAPLSPFTASTTTASASLSASHHGPTMNAATTAAAAAGPHVLSVDSLARLICGFVAGGVRPR